MEFQKEVRDAEEEVPARYASRQIKALYELKVSSGLPMTFHARRALLDRYLALFPGLVEERESGAGDGPTPGRDGLS